MSFDSMFDEAQSKVIALNTGLLNSNNTPSHYNANQCNQMGMLSLELNSALNDFNSSNKYEEDVRAMLGIVNKIEDAAIKVNFDLIS